MQNSRCRARFATLALLALALAAPARESEVVVPELDALGTSHRPVCGEGWYTNDLAAAEEQALREGKPLLVIFEKEDCKFCRRFSAEYLKDAAFADLFRSGALVVVKRFFKDTDRQRFVFSGSPSFYGFAPVDGGFEPAEYIPGLFDKDILAKRISDLIAGRGRLARTLAALRADPDDLESALILIDEYLPPLSLNDRAFITDRACSLDPTCMRCLIARIETLTAMARSGFKSAELELTEIERKASAGLEAAAETPAARDLAVLGLLAEHAGRLDESILLLERAIGDEPRECVLAAEAIRAIVLRAGQRAQKRTRGVARRLLDRATTHFEKSRARCGELPVFEDRRVLIEEQWRRLGIDPQPPLARLQVVAAGDVFPVETFTFLTDLQSAMNMARKELRAYLQVATRAPDDPAFASFQQMLASSKQALSAISVLVRVRTVQERVSVSPMILLQITEPVLVIDGRYVDTPGGVRFVMPGVDPQNSPTVRAPAREEKIDGIVRSVEGLELLRNRPVESFIGIPDATDFAERVWLAAAGENRLDDLSARVLEPRAPGVAPATLTPSSEDHSITAARELLSDRYRGLLRLDAALAAAEVLMGAEHGQTEAAYRILQVAMTRPIEEREAILGRAESRFGADSAAGRLLAGQRALRQTGQIALAIEHLEQAAALAPNDPYVAESIAGAAIVLATGTEGAERDAHLIRARRAIKVLEATVPLPSSLAVLRSQLEALEK